MTISQSFIDNQSKFYWQSGKVLLTIKQSFIDNQAKFYWQSGLSLNIVNKTSPLKYISRSRGRRGWNSRSAPLMFFLDFFLRSSVSSALSTKTMGAVGRDTLIKRLDLSKGRTEILFDIYLWEFGSFNYNYWVGLKGLHGFEFPSAAPTASHWLPHCNFRKNGRKILQPRKSLLV